MCYHHLCDKNVLFVFIGNVHLDPVCSEEWEGIYIELTIIWIVIICLFSFYSYANRGSRMVSTLLVHLWGNWFMNVAYVVVYHRLKEVLWKEQKQVWTCMLVCDYSLQYNSLFYSCNKVLQGIKTLECNFLKSQHLILISACSYSIDAIILFHVNT